MILPNPPIDAIIAKANRAIRKNPPWYNHSEYSDILNAMYINIANDKNPIPFSIILSFGDFL